jgi:hypothetical protein
MQTEYGNACVSRTTVVKWQQKFHSRGQGTNDEARPRQAYVIATPGNVEKSVGGCSCTSSVIQFCAHSRENLGRAYDAVAGALAALCHFPKWGAITLKLREK